MLAQIIKKIPLYISVFIICLFVFISIFSYLIIPDKTTNANSINLIIKSKKPGFKKKFFENVSNEYKLKDLFFGSNIRSESYAIDDYEIINDSVLKIINYDEFNNSVIDEKIISIKTNSIYIIMYTILKILSTIKNLFLELIFIVEIFSVEYYWVLGFLFP